LPCYRCFVGDAVDAVDCDTCAEDGLLGAMAGWPGTFAALQAVRVLTAPGMGDPLWGSLHLLDGLAPAMRTMRIAKDPECRACGSRAA
jgi:molybdopterin/thiamine biosynthesis adenylyltransferase